MSNEELVTPQEGQQPQEAPPSQTTKRSYNPFIDVVNEKPYSQMKVDVAANQMGASIPEPTYQANSVSANENPYNMLNNDFGASMGAQQKGNQPFNPAMNSVSDNDSKMGAEHLARLIIDGYDQLHIFANKMLQIPERKLRKMVAEGEIDLNVEIPYEYGKTITAGQFIQEFNEQNKDTLVVTKEFKKEVTPVLTRVLQKRGAGLTDEQYLAFLFGKDIVVKGVIVSQVRGTMNDMLNVIKDYTIALKENGGTPVAAQQKSASTPPTPPPPPTPPQQPVYNEPTPIVPFDADDFNFRDNETVVESTVHVQKLKVPESGKARLMAQKKRDREIEDAINRAKGNNPAPSSSYEEALSKRKSGNGKRGRKPKDYIIPLDEEQIAEAIILSETKEKEKGKIEGLD